MMASRILIISFLLVDGMFPSFQENINNSTIIQSNIDVEGNRIYKYIFNKFIDKEPEVSLSNAAADLETGDQIIPTDQTETSQRLNSRKLIEYQTMLWPQRTVPYYISHQFSRFVSDLFGSHIVGIPTRRLICSGSDARAKILAGIKHWESVTCLTFIPKDEISVERWGELRHSNFLNIVNARGCASYVGFQPGRPGQYVFLKQSSCMKISTILHELGHAIGFYHEQNRGDRDEYIDVNLENVKPGHEHNFGIFPSLNNVTYDYNSVMHYGRTYFSSNDLETMISKDQNLGFLLGNDEDLTFYDIKTANLAYDCGAQCSTGSATACDNGGYIDASCSCRCPDVLEGERCERLVSYLDKEECGSEVITLGADEKVTVTSPNYPAHYPNNMTCGWLIKSPPETNMTVAIMLDDIPRNTRTHKCYHSLELRYNLIGQPGPSPPETTMTVGIMLDDIPRNTRTHKCYHSLELRYNLIGQPGPRLCGTTDHLLHLQTTGNTSVAILHTGGDYYGAGFVITFSTGQRASVCIPNPCKNAGEVCQETVLGSYECKCPSHLKGQHCDIVDTITCDFDVPMGPEELCLFSQSSLDNIDWRRKQGSTSSSGTGPDDDITGGGSYLFIEASKPTQTGDKAVLRSAKITGGTKCLSFYYHMYGSSTGQLHVLTLPTSKSMPWVVSGEQGPDWIEAKIDLNMTKIFMIEIEAVRGSGYRSDIAIDSVHLTNGKCETGVDVRDIGREHIDTGESFQSCSGHLLGDNCDHINDIFCDFDDDSDNGGWCLFRNASNSDIHWSRYKGETQTDYTGPSSDVSGSGYYLYVDATVPAKQGDAATIVTPFIHDGLSCIDFYIHMYGDEQNMGTLNVTFIDTEKKFQSFITSSNHGNAWNHCRFSVKSDFMFNVVFSYIVGSGFRGDLAIDNFSVAHGSCTHASNQAALPGELARHCTFII